MSRAHRDWLDEAIRRVEADGNRSADTHLHVFPLPESWDVDLYLKDESVHPAGTSREKIEMVELHGGRCHLVDDPAAIYDESRRLAAETGGHFMDQFTYAERATDWRGNNNIAESIFGQLAQERHPVPEWVVVGAGTGGTSATIGRFVRYRRYHTRVCVVDPENSAFYEGWRRGDPSYSTGRGSRIEGIGRPRVEPSFVASVVDAMVSVPDAASIAAARWCSQVTGRLVGGSTGTALWGAQQLVSGMCGEGRAGSVVTMLCDGGERYTETYYDDGWLADAGIDIAPYQRTLEQFAATGDWVAPAPSS